MQTDLCPLPAADLVRLSNEASRLKSELSSTYLVISENARKWVQLIESIDDETDRDAEQDVLEK